MKCIKMHHDYVNVVRNPTLHITKKKLISLSRSF